MKEQLKFIIWVAVIVILLLGTALYQKGYFTKAESNKVVKLIEKNNSSEVESSPENQQIQIASIDKSFINQNVSIIGDIVNRKEHKNGHVFLTVKDSSGEILVPIFADKKINTDTYITGSRFLFTGLVDEYQGQLEIIPSKQDDIMAVPSSTTIENKDVGKTLTVNGKILSKYTHPQGHIFLIAKIDSTGQEIDIPLFNSLHPTSDDYPINSEISLKGKVGSYKGKLQLIPNSLSDINVLNKGNDLDVKNVKVSNITESYRGQMVIVKGFVKEVTDKNGHLFFKIEQDGKEIKAVLFKADSQELEGRRKRIFNAEKARFQTRFLGMVDVYNGELEIVIDKALVD